jgi:hypothetical protein
MSQLFRLPPEVFSFIASHLSVAEVVKLREVCRLCDASVQRWKSNTAHPLHLLFTRCGLFWFRTNGVFFTKKFEVGGLDAPVPIRGTEPFAKFLSVDDDFGTSGVPGMAQLMLFGRTHCVTTIVGRTIYRFGGRVWSHEVDVRLKSCFSVDPLQRTATPLPPMTIRRSAAAGAAVGSRIFVMGGYDGISESNTMEVFDTTSKKWLVWDESSKLWNHDVSMDETVSVVHARVIPFSLCEHSATTVAERYVMIFGGCQHRGLPDETSVSSVWLMDTRDNSWTQLGNMPCDRILGCSSYQSYYNADHDTVHHCVVFYGGESLRQVEATDRTPPPAPATLILRWSSSSNAGDDMIAALRNARWESSVKGGNLALNAIALISNATSSSSHPPELQIRVVDGDIGLRIAVGFRDPGTREGADTWVIVADGLTVDDQPITAVCQIA